MLAVPETSNADDNKSTSDTSSTGSRRKSLVKLFRRERSSQSLDGEQKKNSTFSLKSISTANSLESVNGTKSSDSGLITLYTPPTDILLDIVAVHGLGGHLFRTWTSQKTDKLWLRDFLPGILPTARISTFGYKSKVAFNDAISGIHQFALELLTSIMTLRGSGEKTDNIPLLFICHSLGGIVCKKAIVIAHEQACYAQILQIIKGVVFMGTPHRGSSIAQWSTVLADVASYLGVPLRKDLLTALKPKSNALVEITNSFTHRTQQLQIVSCTEQVPLSGTSLIVVDNDSAVLNLPNEEVIPLYRDHRDICRFDDIDEDLNKIFNGITRMTTKLRVDSSSKDHSNRDEKQAAADAQLRRECLRAIFSVHYEFHLQNISKRHPGTCEWILKTDKYREFREKISPTSMEPSTLEILALFGGPGCGKTVASRCIIEDLQKKSTPKASETLVAYFHCSEQDKSRITESAVLRALLHQLASQYEYLCEPLRKMWNQYGERFLEVNSLVWEALICTIHALRSQRGHPRVWVVIDAIDELHAREEKSLTDKLLTLGSKPDDEEEETAWRADGVVITSRSNSTISLSNKATSIFMEPSTITTDISSCVETLVRQFQGKINLPDTHATKIISILVEKSDGMFLWAVLAWAEFEEWEGLWDDAAVQDKLSDLEKLPKGLQGLYERMFEKIKVWNDASIIFSWLIASPEELSLDSLSYLIPLTKSPHQIENLDLLNKLFDVEQNLKRVCGNFIRFRRSSETTVVEFCHLSVKEFLTGGVSVIENKTEDDIYLESDSESDDESKGKRKKKEPKQEEIPKCYINARYATGIAASNLLRFLCMPIFCRNDLGLRLSMSWLGVHIDNNEAKLEAFLKETPLYRYAAINGIILTQAILGTEGEMFGLPLLLQKLTKSIIHVLLITRVILTQKAIIPDFSLVKKEEEQDNWVRFHRTGYKYYDHSCIHNKTRISSLHLAVILGSEQIMRYLLDIKEDPNPKDSNGRTPLHWAAVFDRVEMLNILLSVKNIDPNATDIFGRTPLYYQLIHRVIFKVAPDVEKQIIVPFLTTKLHYLKKNTIYDTGNTLLHYAITNSWAEVTERLLWSVSVRIDIPNDTGAKAMDWMLRWGNRESIRLYMERFDYRSRYVDDGHGDKSSFHKCVGEIFVLSAQHGWEDEVTSWWSKTTEDCACAVLDTFNRDGRNLLHISAIERWSGPVERWKKLMKRNYTALREKRNLHMNHQDIRGRTPLHYCAENGLLRMFKWFEEAGADLTIPDHEGRTVLHLAAEEGAVDLVRYILDNHASKLLHVADNYGRLPLQYCILQDMPGLARMMLDCGARDEADHDGHTALSTACLGGNIDVVRELCSMDPDAVYLVDKAHNTPLLAAAKGRQRKVLLHLLLSCISPDGLAKMILKRDVFERSVFQLVLPWCDTELLECLFDLAGTIEVTRGEIMSQRDVFGRNLLHYAAEVAPLENIMFLVSMKCTCLTERSAQGLTALEIAASRGRVEIVNFLVGIGAMRNAAMRGYNAFRLACDWSLQQASQMSLPLGNLVRENLQQAEDVERKKVHELAIQIPFDFRITTEEEKQAAQQNHRDPSEDRFDERLDFWRLMNNIEVQQVHTKHRAKFGQGIVWHKLHQME